MTSDTSPWPLPQFQFVVDIDGVGPATFQEVSGLDNKPQVIDYRAAATNVVSKIKMPGLVKPANVICKKGIFGSDTAFRDWYSQIAMNTARRVTVTVALLDEAQRPTMVWTLQNAWPTKISGADPLSDGAGIAIETLVLAHEGLSIKNM